MRLGTALVFATIAAFSAACGSGGSSPAAPPTPAPAAATTTAAANPPASSSQARIEVTPNPATGANVTISWDTGGGDGSVYVKQDQAEEKLFAHAPKGTQEATWIQPKSTYEFRLYAGTDHSAAPIATVQVRRQQ